MYIFRIQYEKKIPDRRLEEVLSIYCSGGTSLSATAHADKISYPPKFRDVHSMTQVDRFYAISSSNVMIELEMQ